MVSAAPGTDAALEVIDLWAPLLDYAGAIGWMQITFTDLDVGAYGAWIAPFADLGLVDTALQAKPALAQGDAVFARPRR